MYLEILLKSLDLFKIKKYVASEKWKAYTICSKAGALYVHKTKSSTGSSKCTFTFDKLQRNANFMHCRNPQLKNSSSNAYQLKKDGRKCGEI